MRIRTTVIILLLALLIGLALGYQRMTVLRGSAILTTRKQQFILQIAEQDQQIKLLESQIDELSNELKIYQEMFTATDLDLALQAAKDKLGLNPMEGSGIVILLDDSKQPPQAGEDPNYYIVHDWQIRNLVRYLFGIGAKGVAVNDQRIIFNSEIVCAGPVIIVNGKRISPPYYIYAIGDPATLTASLQDFPDMDILSALRDTYGLVFQVRQSDRLSIPGLPVELVVGEGS
ncbi:DUF881 domain-containing protein [Coprothermobacteraceae bacterium]|nr:DUF881 domain-containing protein [Coprothermobacteraceae bacterium]